MAAAGVLGYMRTKTSSLATCAILALALSTVACGTGHSTTSTGAGATSIRTPPATSGLPGVVNCTSVPPLWLSVRPSSIPLACADDGIGVEKLTWTAWTATTATGQGTLWEHVCVPSCAESRTYAYYPVAVTLSTVKSAGHQTWFSLLMVRWMSSPPASLPSSFGLESPAS
jgi:hypothetical protein